MIERKNVDGVATLRIGKLECEIDVCSVMVEEKKSTMVDTARLGDSLPHYVEVLDITPQRITIDGFFRGYVDKTDSSIPKINKVIFNPPATIVLWADGTKTVVKCQNMEWCRHFGGCLNCRTYDPEKGLAMCIAKKALGNKGNYYNEFKRWLEDDGNDKDTD